jgi:GMP synthase (glutamine-hydrolysing)
MSSENVDGAVTVAAEQPRANVGSRRRWVISRRRQAADTAVVLHHRDDAPRGPLLDVLNARGFEPIVVRVDRGEPLPDPGSVQLAVVIGSDRLSQHADRWVDTELDWLRRVDNKRTAVLALGSGAQMLATALGGAVERLRQPRRGWVYVTTTEPRLISSGPWLAWQDEAIRLPPRAELLAHDRVGPQAFRVNRHLGVQFHPEVTPEIVSEWIAASHEVLDTQGIMEATRRDFRVASGAAQRMFSAFFDSVGDRRR